MRVSSRGCFPQVTTVLRTRGSGQRDGLIQKRDRKQTRNGRDVPVRGNPNLFPIIVARGRELRGRAPERGRLPLSLDVSSCLELERKLRLR